MDVIPEESMTCVKFVAPWNRPTSVPVIVFGIVTNRIVVLLLNKYAPSVVIDVPRIIDCIVSEQGTVPEKEVILDPEIDHVAVESVGPVATEGSDGEHEQENVDTDPEYPASVNRAVHVEVLALEGMYTFVKDVTPCSIFPPKDGGFLEPNVIAERVLQPTNAFSPIYVILNGIMVVNNVVHPLNALSPIERTLDGIVIEPKLVHW